jgi:hypothetical protein
MTDLPRHGKRCFVRRAALNTLASELGYDRPVSSYPQGPVPPAQPPWPTAAPQAAKQSRWPTLIVAVIALIAVALAVVGWFRPVAKETAEPPSPAYTDQQVADAKAKVCDVYEKVHHAVYINSHRDLPTDPTSNIAVATSARQALDVGSRYLASTLTAEPATPGDLHDAVQKLANTFETLAINYLAEVGNSELNPMLTDADNATLAVEALCK